MISKAFVDSIRQHRGALITNVPVYIPFDGRQEYYRMCIVDDNSADVEWAAFEDCFILLAASHPKSKECHDALWLCDLVYHGCGWEDMNGKYYGVDVFKVHPRKLLQQRQ